MTEDKIELAGVEIVERSTAWHLLSADQTFRPNPLDVERARAILAKVRDNGHPLRNGTMDQHAVIEFFAHRDTERLKLFEPWARSIVDAANSIWL